MTKSVKLSPSAHKEGKIKAAENETTMEHLVSVSVIYVARLIASGKLTFAKVEKSVE